MGVSRRAGARRAVHRPRRPCCVLPGALLRGGCTPGRPAGPVCLLQAWWLQAGACLRCPSRPPLPFPPLPHHRFHPCRSSRRQRQLGAKATCSPWPLQRLLPTSSVRARDVVASPTAASGAAAPVGRACIAASVAQQRSSSSSKEQHEHNTFHRLNHLLPFAFCRH